MPFKPRGARSVGVLHWRPDSTFPVEELTRLVFRALNFSKQARVAIIGGTESLEEIPEHIAKHLDPKRNYHWSGIDRRLELERHLPRTLIGEYTEWFQWYMGYQRFKAFQTVILIDPVAAASEKGTGGLIDGLLARLVSKVPQIIVITRGASGQSPLRPEEHLKGVLLSMLYGTRLSRGQVADLVRLTFLRISDQILEKTLEGPLWQIRRRHSRYELTDDDEELVQGMVQKRRPYDSEEPPDEIEQLFQRNQRREYIRPEDKWIEDEIFTLAKTNGWFTTQTLGDYFQRRFGQFASSGAPPPTEAYPYDQRESGRQTQIFLPSPSTIRRVCNSLVSNGRLTKTTWYREIGRPAAVYSEPGTPLPFKEEARCGQCAFYKWSKNQCRVWWLADKKHRFYEQWWKRLGSGVGEFEMYKMKYSSRVGPHSSACQQFLDKKRDHLRKIIPPACEICGFDMPQPAGKKIPICPSCGTKYVPFRGKVKVLTSYEHEFRRRYKGITDSEAQNDIQAWKAEMAASPSREYETKLELDTEPDIVHSVEGQEPEPPLRARPLFSPLLQHMIEEKAQSTKLATSLSLAMVQSALNATRSVGAIGRLQSEIVEEANRRQARYLFLIPESDPSHLLTHEAHALKEYWHCYDMALEVALQWFGPRKKYRFVSEYVDDPMGRAKGYSAVHAAINYLHQRRLRQAMRINSEVGFEGVCDGFLHRERHNSRHFGLLFDMIDPFKFADREELLAVVLNRGITWRDFKMESDRHQSTFYYPAPTAAEILDRAGVDADQRVVRYQGIDSSLTDAYRRFASSFLSAIETKEGLGEFEPFVYSNVTT